MTDTVRLGLLHHLLHVIKNIDITGPNDADSLRNSISTHFKPCVLGPIGDEQGRVRYAAGVVPGDEVKITHFPLVDCELPVTIEFRMVWNVGDKLPEEEGERILGLIQKNLAQDRSLLGKAIDFTETGNSIVLDLFADKLIVGAVHYMLKYRHVDGNPYAAV